MRNVWRDVLDPIIPYETGTPPERLAAQLGLPELVRLSANENPLGPSPRVVRGHPVEDGAPDVPHGPILVSLRRI